MYKWAFFLVKVTFVFSYVIYYIDQFCLARRENHPIVNHIFLTESIRITKPYSIDVFDMPTPIKGCKVDLFCIITKIFLSNFDFFCSWILLQEFQKTDKFGYKHITSISTTPEHYLKFKFQILEIFTPKLVDFEAANMFYHDIRKKHNSWSLALECLQMLMMCSGGKLD